MLYKKSCSDGTKLPLKRRKQGFLVARLGCFDEVQFREVVCQHPGGLSLSRQPLFACHQLSFARPVALCVCLFGQCIYARLHCRAVGAMEKLLMQTRVQLFVLTL